MSSRPPPPPSEPPAPSSSSQDDWQPLASSSLLDLWSFGFSYGIVQNYLTSSPDSPLSSVSWTGVSAITTLSLAIMYSSFLFVPVVLQRARNHAQVVLYGALVAWAALMIGSSFANKLWELVVFQGLLAGLAGAFVYLPIILYLPDWFNTPSHRFSLPALILLSGSGISGFVFPLIIGALLTHTGYGWTLRVWTALVVPLSLPALRHVGERVRTQDTSSRSARAQPLGRAWMRDPMFLGVAGTTFLHSLAYFPISVYLPTYTASLGLGALSSQLVLGVFNLCTLLGQALFSLLPGRAMLVAALGAAATAYFLLEHTTSTGRVFAFAAVFGALAGGFPTVWPGAARDVAGGNTALRELVFALFGVAKGVAAILGPAIAGELYTQPSPSASPAATGSPSASATPSSSPTPTPTPTPTQNPYDAFRPVSLFVGSTMLAAALVSGASIVAQRYWSKHHPGRDRPAGEGGEEGGDGESGEGAGTEEGLLDRTREGLYDRLTGWVPQS